MLFSYLLRNCLFAGGELIKDIEKIGPRIYECNWDLLALRS